MYKRKKHPWQPEFRPGPRWGSSRRSPRPPKLDSRRLPNVALAPYDSRQALVPDCRVQIMVTLVNVSGHDWGRVSKARRAEAEVGFSPAA